MHKIDSDGNVNGGWVAGNPETGQKPTAFTADWLNAVQNEITNVVETAGLSLSKKDNNQLVSAIKEIAREESLSGEDIQTIIVEQLKKLDNTGATSLLNSGLVINAPSVAPNNSTIRLHFADARSAITGESIVTYSITAPDGVVSYTANTFFDVDMSGNTGDGRSFAVVAFDSLGNPYKPVLKTILISAQNSAPDISKMTITKVPESLLYDTRFVVEIVGVTDADNDSVTYGGISSNANLLNFDVNQNTVTLKLGSPASNTIVKYSLYVDDVSGNRSYLVKDQMLTIQAFFPVVVPTPMLNINAVSMFNEDTTHPQIRITNYDAKYTYQIDYGEGNGQFMSSDLVDDKLTLVFTAVDQDEQIVFKIRAIGGNTVSAWNIVNVTIANLAAIEDQAIVFDAASMAELNLTNGIVINGQLHNPTNTTATATSNPINQEAGQKDWVGLTNTISKFSYPNILTQEGGQYYLDNEYSEGTKLWAIKGNQFNDVSITNTNLISVPIPSVPLFQAKSNILDVAKWLGGKTYVRNGTFVYLVTGDGKTFYLYADESNQPYNYILMGQLSTPYDITTCNVLGSVRSVVLTGMSFSRDGLQFYMQDSHTRVITQLSLKTPWDIRYVESTYEYILSREVHPSVTVSNNAYKGMTRTHAFSPDGKRMVTVGYPSDSTIRYYNLATPYMLNSATYSGCIAPVEKYGYQGYRGIAFNKSGTIIYFHSNSETKGYELASAGDITTINTEAVEVLTHPTSVGDSPCFQIYDDYSKILVGTYQKYIHMYDGFKLHGGTKYRLDTSVDADFLIVSPKDSVSVTTQADDTGYQLVGAIDRQVVSSDQKNIVIKYPHATTSFDPARQLTFKLEVSPRASLLSLTSTITKEA